MMDNTHQSTSQGVSTRSPPDSKPPAASSGDRPTFTFIDQDDDLTSKRIKDVNSRKAIRSHVMRDVRRRERLAGTKRVPKRDSHAAQSEAPGFPMHFKDLQKSRKLPMRAASPSSGSSSSADANPEPVRHLVKSKQPRRRPAKWSAGYSTSSHPAPNPRFLPTSWLIDPFSTLPAGTEAPSVVAHLLFYWKTVFVPMTFPVEQKVSQRAEVELMVKSAFSDPGSFFGLLSMCAAHRAILSGRHSDLVDSSANYRRVLHDQDYYIMKAKCIREMNKKVRDPSRALSNEAFDTIINLLTSALIVGCFDEARIHLTGLKQMVDLRGGITEDSIRNSSMLAAIITTDVKAASGLMAKPVFQLTWDAQPVSANVQQKIKPIESSIMSRQAAALFANPLLSLPLLRILNVVRDIIFFSQTYKENPNVLSSEDHDFFRVLNCEAEYQLLSYIYPETENGGTRFPGTTSNVHPIEAMTRIASICYLNHFLIVSPPSSGLGRALTGHLKKAAESCTLPLLSHLSPENYGLCAWASFIGAQGSAGQPEHAWFIERLTRVAMISGWRSWKQMSDVLTEYFYVPVANGLVWKSIWEQAMAGIAPDVVEL